jgi:hypothetical protein
MTQRAASRSCGDSLSYPARSRPLKVGRFIGGKASKMTQSFQNGKIGLFVTLEIAFAFKRLP